MKRFSNAARHVRRGLLTVAALVLTVSNAAVPMASSDRGVPRDSQLSVMSYNVHGLPWPLATRGADFTAIAAQLRDLRRQGRQPHVIVLQEAFTDAAKAIGTAAGYRYARFGPATTTAALAASDADAAFSAVGARTRGEADGKWTDSGLVIFSDYPIVAARQVAFPVCAGFDCLANKGALAVKLAVPHIAEPVYVVDTHLNAKKAAGVDRGRTAYAYRRQLEVLGAFVAAVVPHGAPLFVAGDFNVGRTSDRRSAFAELMTRPLLSLQSARADCERSADCVVADPRDVAESARHNKDWLLFRPGRTLAVMPERLLAPFGRTADGSMLSDHIGICAAYKLVAATGLRAIRHG